MEKRNVAAGVAAVVFSVLGALYLVRALVLALSSGVSPGKLGAVHAAGSASYFVFVLACLIGLGFMAILASLGLRWSGLHRPGPR